MNTTPKKRGRPKKNEVLEIPESENPLLLPGGKVKSFDEVCTLLLDEYVELEPNYKYISFSVLSAITGIVSTALYQHEQSGKLEVEIIDGKKCINLNSPSVREYFSNRRDFVRTKMKRLNIDDEYRSGKRGPRPDNMNYFVGNSEDGGIPLSRADLAKVQKDEVAAKLGEVKLQKELNVLVLRKFAENVFILFGKTIREMLLPQGQRLAPMVGGIFESVDPEKIRAVQLKIDEENGRCIADVISVVERGILTDDDLYGDIPEINIDEVKEVE